MGTTVVAVGAAAARADGDRLVVSGIGLRRGPQHDGAHARRVLYAGAVAVAVVNAPDVALFSVGAWPIVTLVGAIVMLAGLG